MCPFFKHCAKVRNLVVGICALAIWNCGGDASSGKPEEPIEASMANVMLQMNYVESPLIDSLVLDGFGADTIHLVGNPDAPFFDMDLFPSDHWVFEAKLYANGSLMQTGEIVAKLEAGTKVDLQIQLHALAGFVYVEIPLGFGNPAGIAAGSLLLDDGTDSFSYPMEIVGTTAIFKSDALALNKEYSIELSLQDSSGTTIYNMESSFFLDETTPVPQLQIKSLRSKVSFEITPATIVNKEIELTLPAIKRVPKAGDIIISEFLVNPTKSDSTAFDFIELYNGTNDTLDLNNCLIGKTTNVKESALIEAMILPPRQLLVLGNDTNPNTPEEYKHTELMPTFTKSNQSSAASIVFACNDVVMDSVYYGKLDSLHLSAVPLNSNNNASKSSQLNIDAWNDQDNPENWCVGSPTPGALSFCNE